MRCVIQRVKSAHVEIDGEAVGTIGHGLLALVGFTPSDTQDQVQWLAERLLNIRLFSDANGKMNLSVQDVEGGILVVSQFTLYSNAKKGTRPSFIDASRPEHAEPLYNNLVARIKAITTEQQMPVLIASGVFGAMMQVHLTNDGPVTIILER